MSEPPNIWTIPPGVPFLPTLAEAVAEGRLTESGGNAGLQIADTTIYVPTRRAARTLRSCFVERMDNRAAILPTIRPLGEFDDGAEFLDLPGSLLDALPPVSQHERLFSLAPLVRSWKSRLPAHLASLFDEELIVPASTADAIWLARDLATLLDQVETEEVSWAELGTLVPDELAGWWQITLEFLQIVTEHWPNILKDKQRSDPSAWRSSQINAETQRLQAEANRGPVIAAGSTGSIPATARLLTAIAKNSSGAVVLPGLDNELDDDSWRLIDKFEAAPSVFGHPQYGLKKLLGTLDAGRDDVKALVDPTGQLAARGRLVSEALRPAESTDKWLVNKAKVEHAIASGALNRLALIEAPDERHEAFAVAVALRLAVAEPGHRAALVTGDRTLARRVSAELSRFGIEADDSGGRALTSTPPASLFLLLAETVFRPGDAAALLDLLTHPLLLCGEPRPAARRLAAYAELVLLRGGTGRPDIATVSQQFDERLAEMNDDRHAPFWLSRMDEADINGIRRMLSGLGKAIGPLHEMRNEATLELERALIEMVRAFEAIGRDDQGAVDELYSGDNGEAFAAVLNSLIVAAPDMSCRPDELPDVLRALLAAETVKPGAVSDGRIAIWGVLEARLQSVDTMIVAGLNEGSWPRKAETGRFMSRVLSGGMGLEPPERRTGQAAHDFQMAMGANSVIMSRSERADGAPASRSRWLQRLLAVIGEQAAAEIRGRGNRYLAIAAAIDAEGIGKTTQIFQPCPTPPVDARPRRFSVTEIETLRRDPYAVYARRILKLEPIDPLLRDPGAAERGSLFHEILHEFASAGVDVHDVEAEAKLLEIAWKCFDSAGLPADVRAVWWPRFVKQAPRLVEWEREQNRGVRESHSEIAAAATAIGETGAFLSGRADRIDVLDGGQFAQILDYKTGNTPSKVQAHRLLSPQLALEGELLARGAFGKLGAVKPADLKFIRLKPDGRVEEESIIEIRDSLKTAEQLSHEAWQKLGGLIAYYAQEVHGYRSRALPLREHDLDGDYDHLARVSEWSSGAGSNGGDTP